ncbi:hypothetical protein [Pseudomonas aeruginosa]|uniref:hypothetical protein n=1 Tax=Pseudomonas aeruginosa TaxID=287 RepID=UPI003CEA77DE
MRKVYKFGGFVRLSVNEPQSSLVRELSMDSLPGRFKLAVLTSSPNPKEEYLEWWEFGDSPFRGVVRFGDDEFDSRTVCADISIAEAVFKELYETGGLDVGLAQMRSPGTPCHDHKSIRGQHKGDRFIFPTLIFLSRGGSSADAVRRLRDA